MPSLTTSPVVYGVCIGGCEFPREGGPASALTFAIELRLTEEGDTSCCGMDGTLRASMFTAERTSTAMRRRCSGSCCALNGPITLLPRRACDVWLTVAGELGGGMGDLRCHAWFRRQGLRALAARGLMPEKSPFIANFARRQMAHALLSCCGGADHHTTASFDTSHCGRIRHLRLRFDQRRAARHPPNQHEHQEDWATQNLNTKKTQPM